MTCSMGGSPNDYMISQRATTPSWVETGTTSLRVHRKRHNRGGDGNDTLSGWNDDDLFGDANNDKLYGHTKNNELDGGSGNDTLSGPRAMILDGPVATISSTLTARFKLMAAPETIFPDLWTGSIISARDGNDWMTGAGNDVLYGDDATDTWGPRATTCSSAAMATTPRPARTATTALRPRGQRLPAWSRRSRWYLMGVTASMVSGGTLGPARRSRPRRNVSSPWDATIQFYDRTSSVVITRSSRSTDWRTYH